jgi:3'(2'), 5'-bisphosphate nucleotidase
MFDQGGICLRSLFGFYLQLVSRIIKDLMETTMTDQELLQGIARIAQDAGEEILAVYNDDAPLDISLKEDDSPLTLADSRANAVIVAGLKRLDEFMPVISEEAEMPSFEERSQWHRYWLVDPLDGTKEFISRNGEFTVNIALVEQGVPVLGVVHVPVSNVTYYGGTAVHGAWREEAGKAAAALQPTHIEEATSLLRFVASRSHRGVQVDQLIQQAATRFDAIEVVSMGSSLKMCLLAEGKADCYPRLAPTSEWDTAAAHAVLSAVGGEIVKTDFQPLRYNEKSDILNPHFIAFADPEFAWEELLKPAL